MNINNNRNLLLAFLGLEEEDLTSSFFSSHYGKVIIRYPNSGKTRELNPPSKKLKSVQRRILREILLKRRKVRGPSFGLKGSLKLNINKHQENADGFLLNLDITKFFPNVSYTMIRSVFRRLGFVPENVRLLTMLTTVKKRLPQGAPTSPMLSTLVLESFDTKMCTLAKKDSLVYTRYFDDISISGRDKESIHCLEKIIKDELLALGFSLNTEKRIFFAENDLKSIQNITFNTLDLYVQNQYISQLSVEIREFKTSTTSTYFPYKEEKKIKGKLNYCSFINREQIMLIRKDFYSFCKNKKKLV